MSPAFSPRCALIFSLAVVARVASADSNTIGTWLYPDPNTTPTFNYLDTLNASWTSDFSTPWLHLWCGVTNGNSSSPVLGQCMTTFQISSLSRHSHSDTYTVVYNKTAPATGSLDFPLNYALEPFSCHFELSRQPAVGLGGPFALSGNFSVAIESNAKPVTWSQNLQTSPTATNASSNPEPTASPTPSSNATVGTHPSGSGDLSQGAKAGIGVGVALGVLVLIAAAFVCLRRRKRARPSEPYSKSEPRAQNYASSKAERSEMPGHDPVYEKDSAPVATQTVGELEAPRY